MKPILLICAGAMLAPLDSSVNVAFADITQSFGIAPAQIQWVILPFVMAQSLASLCFGRWGDLYGHRRIFALGLAACVLTHAAITLSADYPTLVIWRAIQGAAVGMVVACAPALVSRAVDVAQIPRALAQYSAAISAGMILGPLLGGLLVHALGWTGVYMYRVLWAAAVLLALPWVLGSETRVIPTGQSRAAWDGRAFRAPHVLVLQASAVLIYLSTFTIMLWVPFLLAGWPELGSIGAGLILAVFPAGALTASLCAARCPWPPGPQHSKAWVRWGLAGAALGLAIAAYAAWTDWRVLLVFALGLCGLGLGAFQSGYFEQTLRWLPADQRGLAGALVNAMRLLGLLMGVPALSALGQHLGIAHTLAIAAGVTAAGLCLLSLLPKSLKVP